MSIVDTLGSWDNILVLDTTVLSKIGGSEVFCTQFEVSKHLRMASISESRYKLI